jgi:hypothetical protein
MPSVDRQVKNERGYQNRSLQYPVWLIANTVNVSDLRASHCHRGATRIKVSSPWRNFFANSVDGFGSGMYTFTSRPTSSAHLVETGDCCVIERACAT